MINKLLKGQMNRFLQLLRNVKRILFPNLNLNRVLFVILNHIRSVSKLDFLDNVQGHKMYLDEKDSLMLSLNGTYEPCETGFFQREVKEGYFVLDIGANIGYYTLLFARQVGVNGHVFAFEPGPTNFALLNKNVEINGYTNVTLINKAVSNNTGKERLFLSEISNGDHRIFDSHNGRESIEIDSIRLDDYFADFDQEIHFIKIDVQGAEYYAVGGMRSLLRRNPNVVLATEFCPFALLCSGTEPRAYLELLLQIGFRIYLIDENSGATEKADIQELLQTYTPENKSFTNLICKRDSC